MRAIVIKRTLIEYTVKGDKAVVPLSQFLGLEDTPRPYNLHAGRDILQQINALLLVGATLRTIKASMIAGKPGTVGRYLWMLRAVSERREISVNPAFVIRKARDCGCMAVLAVL